MCLLLIAWKVHPTCPLIVAANRDEFYRRPTKPIHRWDDGSGIVGGRDLTSGGTWLGVTASGRFAAVTNVRDGKAEGTPPQSRGALPTGFLDSTATPQAYAAAADGDDFAGFNLLASDLDELFWVSNRFDGAGVAVEPGIHGLSNAQLDTPWPKVTAGKAALAAAVSEDSGAPDADVESYFELLHSTDPAPRADLPNTGVGVRREKQLSPLFVRTRFYGTRASTVLRVRSDGSFDLTERTFNSRRQTGETRIEETS
ncbi:NRDE family protein [Antrihabitans cavernicola]|uniref:NRDE family protein n=1 Tax=Antrihabitans cavernicola TaxID=2495913 RepID=A0A5A7S448_9NOCA|nr:NRDE family protein [Spelaeibacter cavernicola]KAA0020169.1 NRDE family protein [Spelaeibacter cavernicola]